MRFFPIGLSLTIIGTACTAIAGCGSDEYGPILLTFDACRPLVLVPNIEATPAELRSLESAAKMWNALSGTQLTFEDVPGADRLPVRFGDAADMFFGRYDDRIGEVFINQRLPDHRRRTIVAAHELGHAFGLVHIDPERRPSVMNSGNWDVAPTMEDGATLRALRADCP